MKKNPRDYKVNGKQYAYILDAICPECADLDPDNMTDKEKVEFVLEQFDKGYNYAYNKKTYPNIVCRFEQWMRGMPSSFCVEFADYRIALIGKAWGYCQTEKNTSAFVNNWWSAIVDKFFQLARKLGVEYAKYM